MNVNDATRRDSRRTFLKYLAFGSAFGAGLSQQAGALTAHAPDRGERGPRVKQGYRETAHVREYYAKASL